MYRSNAASRSARRRRIRDRAIDATRRETTARDVRIAIDPTRETVDRTADRARGQDRTAGVKTRERRDDDDGDGERDGARRDGAGDDDDDEATTRDALERDAGGDGDDRAM